MDARITETTISTDFFAEISVHPGNRRYPGVIDYIKGEYPAATGYLFYQTKIDKRKNLYRCRIFEGTITGDICINTLSDEWKIKAAIEENKKLNAHAVLKEFLPGYTNDDFVRNRITVRLTYIFPSLS